MAVRFELRRIEEISIVACGTSWHAALLGKNMDRPRNLAKSMTVE